MSKEQRDGLFMDNSVFIIDEKKPGFPIQSRVIQFLAILMWSWSSISVLIEALPVPAKVIYVDLAILLCAGIMFTLCLIPAYDVVKLFFGILFYGLFLYSRLPKLMNGFYILENVVLLRLSDYYSYQSSLYIADYSTAGTDCTLLIIMITLPIVILLTIAIVRNHFVNVTSILLFLPISLCFFVGLIPSERYLIAYIAAVLYLTRSGFSTHNVVNEEQKVMLHRIHSRAAVWLSLISVLLFFFLKLFISEKKYDEITQISDMKTEIQTTLFNFTLEDLTKGITNFELPKIGPAAGGLDGGALGKTGKVEYANSEQLQVTAPLQIFDKGVYLKGYVGSVYTGDKWLEHSSETDSLYKELLKKLPADEFAPVNQVSELLKLNRDTLNINLDEMSIKYSDANKKYMYAPYFTDFSRMGNVKYKQDLYAAPENRKDNYTFVFFDPNQLTSENLTFTELINNGNTAQMTEFSEYEKLYSDFVNQVYTKLPETGLDRLKQDCRQVLEENPDYSINDKISYVSDYLDYNTRYTLTPGKLPAGKDFVEYFLYENKKGYCAHYASSAVLMLRALGVPARYVEGYAISASDIDQNTISTESSADQDAGATVVEVSVKDYNAHAWVEIYYEGYGWLPYDFTPVSNIDYSMFGDSEPKPSVTIAPTRVPPTPTPREMKPQKEETKPESTTPETSAAAQQKITKEQHKYDSLFFLVFIILLAGFIAGTAFLLVHRRNKQRNTVNHNKKVILLFARIEKILTLIRGLGKKGAQLEDSEEYVKKHCPFIDTETFAAFMETVRKARYGRERITSAELKQVELFHQKLYESVNSGLPFMKKVYLKLLLFI